MKNVLILLFTPLLMSTLLAQDITGSYEINSLEIMYFTYFAREATLLTATDNHDLDITVVVDTIEAWEIIHETSFGPLTQEELYAVGIFFNIDFYEDGTGHLYAIPFFTSQNYQQCIWTPILLPISEDFTYNFDFITELISIEDSEVLGNLPDSLTYVDITGDGIPDSSTFVGSFVSQQSCNTLTFEVHSADGIVSQVGIYDGEFYDMFALPYLTATYTTEECGLNYAILGDVSSLLPTECISEVSVANDFYIMDEEYSSWGNFATYNAHMFNETGDPIYLSDDSDHDFDGTNGRIVFNFSPQCIPRLVVWDYVLEFNQVDACPLAGDVNASCTVNIIDVVNIVGCILGTLDVGQCECGDMNLDFTLDVADIVIMIDLILMD
ncbi:MAG: hypothetical protein HQ510_07975 [Candidatus Marinimicrobia bacterium]|nr:hypothetical protein [Candidatus Neomarinimicrobiota bacterium]